MFDVLFGRLGKEGGLSLTKIGGFLWIIGGTLATIGHPGFLPNEEGLGSLMEVWAIGAAVIGGRNALSKLEAPK